METLREQMKQRGYLHLDLGPLELPSGLKRKGKVEMEGGKARLFMKETPGVGADEAEEVRKRMVEYVKRQGEKGKTASFYPHPQQDPHSPRTWVVLTE